MFYSNLVDLSRLQPSLWLSRLPLGAVLSQADTQLSASQGNSCWDPVPACLWDPCIAVLFCCFKLSHTPAHHTLPLLRHILACLCPWHGLGRNGLPLCPSTELSAGISPGNCCPQSSAERILGVPWTKSLSLRVPARLCLAAPAPHLSLLMESVSETLSPAS